MSERPKGKPKPKPDLDEIFGDVLPDQTRDDQEPSTDSEAHEEWLKRQVPPHHGG